MNKNYFFDLDGTLYVFNTGIFSGSSLQKTIKENACLLLSKLHISDPTSELIEMEKQYGEDFSLAFEEKYSLSKKDYFSFVWNIDPQEHLIVFEDIRDIFQQIIQRGDRIYILSDAPSVWINRVLAFLNISSFLTGIYSGEGEERKSNGLLYHRISEEISGQKIMIGDQEKSDIIIPSNYEFETIYISRNGSISNYANKNITSLGEILS